MTTIPRYTAQPRPGRYSLDAALGFQWASTPAVIWIALAAGVLGGGFNLALRRRPAAPGA